MAERFLVGEAVGGNRILRVVGSGGSGEVFKAEHTITKRIEALKVLGYGRPRTIEDEQRFLCEIQLQAALDHPNVASVHNAFWTDGRRRPIHPSDALRANARARVWRDPPRHQTGQYRRVEGMMLGLAIDDVLGMEGESQLRVLAGSQTEDTASDSPDRSPESAE